MDAYMESIFEAKFKPTKDKNHAKLIETEPVLIALAVLRIEFTLRCSVLASRDDYMTAMTKVYMKLH